MQRSSESIGTIAAALAKAQLELANPAKSLVGVVPGMTPNGDRSFRYAPLSAGLELVRKSLGRHEIATVQTTAIDDQAGLVRLTTVLAHASGEWISSEWPVCPVSDTDSPQRMGAALTYARRHSLFALVGIAGEDDLDAPILGDGVEGWRTGENVAAAPSGANNGQPVSGARPASSSRGRPPERVPKPVLAAEASANKRDELLAEIALLSSADELVTWAGRVLPTKNSLQAEDAGLIEVAFESKMGGCVELASDSPAGTTSEPTDSNASDAPLRQRVTSRPKTPRRRDKRHLEYVASKPCLICGRTPSDAHHLRFAEPRALGRKVSDEFTVPLCRIHHRQLHSRGDERVWWEEVRIDPRPIAQQLWDHTVSPIKAP